MTTDDQFCRICLDFFSQDETKGSITLFCEHAFHTECIGEWFKIGIESKQLPLTCPSCFTASQEAEIKSCCATPELYDKLVMFRKQAEVDNNDDLEWCPSPGCDNYYQKTSTHFKCSKCHHHYCTDCRQALHTGFPCLLSPEDHKFA